MIQQRNARRQYKSASRPPKTTTGFDPETGQVFTDTEIRFSRKQHSDWICENKTPGLFKTHQPPNDDGARSLFDMAKNKVARNFRSLGVAHFSEGISWEVAEQLWKELDSM